MKVEFINLFTEKTFFFLPSIVYNRNENEILFGFLIFACLISFNPNDDEKISD